MTSMKMERRQFLSAGTAAAMAAAACGSATAFAAIDEASADSWLGAAPEIAAESIVRTEETDLLIVGAGNAGMVAAATAADLGMNFILAEKITAVQFTRHFVGAVDSKFQKELGITCDKMKLLNELTRYASGKCDQNVWKTWINESGETIDFIDEIMAAAGYLMYFDNEDYDHATGGTDYYVPMQQHMWYWPEVAEICPPAVWGHVGNQMGFARNEALEQYINGLGYSISYSYKLEKLVREDGGRVTGAIFETDDGYVQINAAKGVLLATGGYANNPKMIRALAPAILDACTAGDYMPNVTGEGIKAGIWAGARMDREAAPMIFDRGAVLPGESVGYVGEGDKVSFPSMSAENCIGSLPVLKINRRGERFMNESCPYDFTANQAAQQPGGVWCCVFDSTLPQTVSGLQVVGCAKTATQLLAGTGSVETAVSQFPNGEAFIEAGGLISADTIEELAEKLGVPADTLAATVERNNELFDKGVDEDYGKEGFRLTEVRTAPFYGIWFGGTLLTTLDGLKINEDMQVLDNELEVIPGLYAAGDCSGSMFSGNYPEYLVGCAAGRTLTEGRHAVRYINDNE